MVPHFFLWRTIFFRHMRNLFWYCHSAFSLLFFLFILFLRIIVIEYECDPIEAYRAWYKLPLIYLCHLPPKVWSTQRALVIRLKLVSSRPSEQTCGNEEILKRTRWTCTLTFPALWGLQMLLHLRNSPFITGRHPGLRKCSQRRERGNPASCKKPIWLNAGVLAPQNKQTWAVAHTTPVCRQIAVGWHSDISPNRPALAGTRFKTVVLRGLSQAMSVLDSRVYASECRFFMSYLLSCGKSQDLEMLCSWCFKWLSKIN